MRVLSRISAAALWLLASLAVSAADEITWDDLVPPDARELQEIPLPPHDLAGLGELDDLGNLSDADFGSPAPQMEPMVPVVSTLDGRQIRLPGYVVPLEITAGGTVEELLLVPYFGACIHVPPPPSNQIVHVRSRKGIKLEDPYQPFWITGVIRVESIESELGNAGYRINDASTTPYDY